MCRQIIQNQVFGRHSQMKNMLTKLFIIFTLISVTGCAQMSNQDAGVLTGGVVGGLVGSRFGGGSGQILAIGAGTLLGAYIGGSIGKSMDDADRARMNHALEANAVGQPAYWTNQNSH